jgi:parallel beta-helix repeat protein
MKRSLGAVLFSVCILSGFSTSLASTNVPSLLTQDTRWEVGGSPYLIQGKVAVPKSMTLTIGPGVQVIFQGAAALEVNGILTAEGTATSPVVFNMVEGALQSELFINGGQAVLSNVKILSGVFLVRDSQLVLQGSELTKGSGIYLQGSTEATLNNNKIYGCATGMVLDGTVKVTATFNTLVQNTYGLYLKGFSEIKFQNNSVHDNQVEIINNTPAASLGGNYWGTEDEKAALAKVQGNVKLVPMKSLKDILRFYIRTQLPVISSKQEAALIAKEKKQKLEEQLALKKLKQKEGEEALAARQAVSGKIEVVEAPPAEEEAVAEEAPVKKPKAAVKAQAPAKSKEPIVASAPIPDPIKLTVRTDEIKVLPPVAQTLKPLANLPPDQGDRFGSEGSTSPVAVVEATAEEATASKPEPAPEAVAAATETSEIPPAPPETEISPPALSSTGEETVSTPPSAEPPALSAAEAAPAAPVAAAVAEPKPVPKEVTPTASQATALEALQGTAGDIEGMLVPPLDLSLEIAAPASATTNNQQPDSSSNTETSKKTNGPFDESLTLPPIQNTDIEPPKDLELPPTDDLGKVDLDSRNK